MCNSYAHYNVYYYDRIYALRKNEIQVIIDSQGRAYISDGTQVIIDSQGRAYISDGTMAIHI